MYTSDSKAFRLKPLEVIEHEVQQLAALGSGMQSINRIFLGDGDAMMLPMHRLKAILKRYQRNIT